MSDQKLPINKNILLSLAIIGFIITILAAYSKISGNDFVNNNLHTLLFLAMISQFIPWIIVLIDLIKSKINNKLFWIIGMFAFSSITVIFYLLNRNIGQVNK